METDRGSMRPWLDALTSIWTALIRASLMLVPEVPNVESLHVSGLQSSESFLNGVSPPLGLMFWMYFLASLTWMDDPGTRSSFQQRTLWLKSIMLKESSMVRSSRMACMASTVCGKRGGACRSAQRPQGGGVSQPWMTRAHLLHLDAPHGAADINDEHDVFAKRRKVGRRKKMDEVSV